MPARVLLLGGIGSGKSTAGRLLADLGGIVISADEVARSVLAPGTDATERVLETWPEVGTGGVIDRSALGRIVFSDADELAALEAITHPATRRAITEQVSDHPDRVVIVEMPVLRDWFDEGWVRVVVDAPEELRLERSVARHSSLEADDVRAVMSRQPARREWLLAADYVLDNAGSVEDLAQQCDELWDRLTTDD